MPHDALQQTSPTSQVHGATRRRAVRRGASPSGHAAVEGATSVMVAFVGGSHVRMHPHELRAATSDRTVRAELIAVSFRPADDPGPGSGCLVPVRQVVL